MDMLQKQKWMMLLVISVLTATAVFFMQQRLSTLEYERSFKGVSADDIHKQTLNETSLEYKMLTKADGLLNIYNKNIILTKSQGNYTLFFSIYNKYKITKSFWMSNLACNDGTTNFLNPKFESFEKMTIINNGTKVFPLRIYYPKVELDAPRSFNCKIQITSGINEYASENFVLVLDPNN